MMRKKKYSQSTYRYLRVIIAVKTTIKTIENTLLSNISPEKHNDDAEKKRTTDDSNAIDDT